ncbi:MAG: hypothetical protein J6R01_05695 [Alistipes sp.]|nr:hypothetical protein [Paludibacteraceae bacterium]MBO5831079.1 hypothetical protein [Alistipes sp.]
MMMAVHYVRKVGNNAAHDGKVHVNDSLQY